MPTKTAAPEKQPETPEEQETPLLELSTLAPERASLTVDGTVYEIRMMGEFGIIDQHRIKGETEEFDQLWQRSKLNEKQEKRMKELLDRLFDRVLVAPAEVKKTMSDELRNQVVMGFMLAPLAKAAAQQAREKAETEEED